MKTTMQRFFAWMRKEWRDQRAITIGIGLAVPGLTGLAYWAFGERIGAAQLENVGFTFLAIAVGLVVFAIAGDLFAGENRRGTIHALRRLPGGLGSAFGAKLAFLVLVLLGVIVLQGLSLAVAENLNADRIAKLGLNDYHRNGASRSVAIFEQLGDFPTSPLWLAGLGLGVFGLWTLLVSSWMGRSGVASIGAVVLVAALGVPFALFFKEHPWFFPGTLYLMAGTASVAALVALVALALSFLRGQRYAGRPFRPFLLGASVLVLAVGGGYAYAESSLRSWLSFGPHAEGFRIHEAHIGAGGKRLFLTVSRGPMWDGDRVVSAAQQSNNPWRPRRGTPAQGWVVDLEAGTHTPIDDRAVRYFLDVPELGGAFAYESREPVEALVCDHLENPAEPALRWWDARSGEPARVLPFAVRDASALALVRRQLMSAAWQRDSEGRRVWLRDGRIEREGDVLEAPAGLVARPKVHKGLAIARPVPGGWFGFSNVEGRMEPAVLDADSGELSLIPKLPQTTGYWHAHVLSTEHMLIRKYRKLDKRGARDAIVRILAFADPENHSAPKNEPPVVDRALARDQVLALRGPEHGRTLHVWNPRSGHDRALPWRGPALEGISRIQALGRAGDGRLLIQLWNSDHHTAMALLDADLATLRAVSPWAQSPRRGDRVVALMPDDSLVVVRAGRTVLRLRAGKPSEVLFPTR
ncbi:MAG: hypothetical protein P1V36_04780 [Planctomycetota bacterium]|nr:hypothetical protein [Planctomycetota bacterium]